MKQIGMVLLVVGVLFVGTGTASARTARAAPLTPVGNTGLLAPSSGQQSNYCLSTHAAQVKGNPQVITGLYGIKITSELWASVSTANSQIYCGLLDPVAIVVQAAGQPAQQVTCWLVQFIQGTQVVGGEQTITTQPGNNNAPWCGTGDWVQAPYTTASCNGTSTWQSNWQLLHNNAGIASGDSGRWCQPASAQCSNATDWLLTEVDNVPTDDQSITVDITLFGWMGGGVGDVYCGKMDPFVKIFQQWWGAPQDFICNVDHTDAPGEYFILGLYARVVSSPGHWEVCGLNDWMQIATSAIQCSNSWQVVSEIDHMDGLGEVTWSDFSPEWCYTGV